MADKKKPTGDAAIVQEVMHGFEEDEKPHAALMVKVEKRYKSYRGVLEIRSKAAGWTSKQHPPYILQVIESMIANLVDPRPGWRVRCRPRYDSPDEIELLARGARANELLLQQQADCDRLGEKEPLFVKQVMIAGLSAYKTYWNFAEGQVPRQVLTHEPVYDEQQGLVGHLPKLGVSKSVQTIHDDPGADVVDVRDFIWHQAAISLDKAQRVTHRVLYTMDELRNLQAAGVYRNVEQLSETKNEYSNFSQREQGLFESDRGKDKIEVLEQWRRTRTGIQVSSVGNRKVLLADKPNPFWHGQFPFVVCSSIPDLFRIPGLSEVELIEDLQEMAWQLANQRLDNLTLLNNAIVLIRSDVDDYDQFEWAPGAQWIVDDPAQVSTLQVSPEAASISLQAEELIKQDLQNVPGTSPSLLGQIDPSTQTATEISTTTSLGMRRIQIKRQQFRYCHGRLGEQWLSLNQQFIRSPRLLETVGPGGVSAFQHIHPLLLQGSYYIDLEAMDESLVRQERKAEAQSTLQVAMAAAPIFASLAQGGQVPMLNMKAFMDDVLEAAGISDKERYYNPPTPQQPQLPPGQPPGQPQQNGQPPGATAPQATDLNSPSNAFSQSPVAALQRMAAMAGGPSNAPSGRP